MLVKACPVLFKAGAADGLAEGEFEAYVSVFGNVDSYGDRVLPGAFNDTLADWKASGDPIPLVWSHQYADPMAHIGVVLDAHEDEHGLKVHARLDLDDDAPVAKQVYRLLKGKRVKQFSFSYDIEDGGPAEVDGRHAFDLRKLKLYEVGPTLVGANSETNLLGVKSLMNHALVDIKAGRSISAKNEELLRAAHSSIGVVLGALDGNDSAAKALAPAPVVATTPAPRRGPRLELSDLLALDINHGR